MVLGNISKATDTRFDRAKVSKIQWIKALKETKRFKQVHMDNILTLDIEVTTAFFDDAGNCVPFDHDMPDMEGYEPSSVMYIWQTAAETGSDILVTMGRTYETMDDYFERLCLSAARAKERISRAFSDETAKSALDALKAAKGKKYSKPILHIFIHNDSYEFQFLRNLYNERIKQVFARQKLKPMKFSVDFEYGRIVFHDSYVLVQKSLKHWGEDEKLQLKKIAGGLDYLKIRTPATPLTEDELAYCEYDVVTMVHGLKKYRERYGHIYDIPMTQTGQVRRLCKAPVIGSDWEKTCQETYGFYKLETYRLLSNYVYGGGWTHANRKYTYAKIRKRMACFDFTSSYVGVMMMCRYPLTPFRSASPEDWEKLQAYDVNARPRMGWVVVRFTGVKCRLWNTFFSRSKAIEAEGVIEDNGKIYSAKSLLVALCDLDYDIFKQVYDIETEEILRVYLAEAGYIPRELFDTIANKYADKTELKGNKERDSEYKEGKQLVCSIYGCAVTKTITDEVQFTKDEKTGEKNWTVRYLHAFDEEGDGPIFEKLLMKEMEGHQFMSYQVGVWVAAWARHNLWDGILALDEHVVYGDTDSIKAILVPGVLEWFEKYNKEVVQARIDAAMRFYGITDPDIFAPKTLKGVPKPVGYFDREDDAVAFRTLGAKRYCYETEDGELHVVVAGLPKADPADPENPHDPNDPRAMDDKGLPNSWQGMIRSIDDFRHGIVWDTRQACKTRMVYDDHQKERVFVDYRGNSYTCRDRYGICAIPTTCSMSFGDDYADFLDYILAFGAEDDDTRLITKDIDISDFLGYNGDNPKQRRKSAAYDL